MVADARHVKFGFAPEQPLSAAEEEALSAFLASVLETRLASLLQALADSQRPSANVARSSLDPREIPRPLAAAVLLCYGAAALTSSRGEMWHCPNVGRIPRDVTGGGDS